MEMPGKNPPCTKRLRKVAVLASRNASYGRFRDPFKVKSRGLLDFANDIIHDGRASLLINIISKVTGVPPSLINPRPLLLLIRFKGTCNPCEVLALCRNLAWMLQGLESVVNLSTDGIMGTAYAFKYFDYPA